MNDEEIIQSFDTEKDKSLKMQLQKVEGLDHCIVILLSGYVDTYNSTFFQKRITTLIEAGYIRIVRIWIMYHQQASVLLPYF